MSNTTTSPAARARNREAQKLYRAGLVCRLDAIAAELEQLRTTVQAALQKQGAPTDRQAKDVSNNVV